MPTRWTLLPLIGATLLLVSGCTPAARIEAGGQEKPEPAQPEPPRKLVAAPELDGGVAWLNTAGPLRMKDLRGKIVLLDFWTFCCINCIHTLPDLAKLEKKYPNELVVIGVHSAKFDQEKETEAIRKAILRYEIQHPVVNDANRVIWERYEVEAWPSLYLIDPEGNLIARGSGEGLYEAVDESIAKLIKKHKENKTLNEKPLKFELARASETGQSPLFFPGKVLADAKSKRLFIADSTHHRVVITDLDGKKIAIAGNGVPGLKDGTFAQAQFDDPQGMALDGETLYVADRKNHAVRALNLTKQTVTRIAGKVQTDLNGKELTDKTGNLLPEQGRDRDGSGDALKVALNSPWALLIHENDLYIASAGSHQIWTYDLKRKEVGVWAGNGMERRRDGPRPNAAFAQPSGLATDGKSLFVADSEVSSIRAVGFGARGEVTTLVGKDLFVFGDVDGEGDDVRLQHALGVAFHDGKVFVADTYNSKIKVIDPAKRSCKTWLAGDPEGWLATPLFNEPAGISIAGDKLYVADTNAHRVRVVDLKTKAVSTLKLQGVEAPAQPKP